MERNALLLYLRELRDLEIAKRKIKVVYDRETKNHRQRLSSLSNAKLMKVPDKESGWSRGRIWGFLICLSLTIMGAIVAFVLPMYVKPTGVGFCRIIGIPCMIIYGVICIGIGFMAVSDTKENEIAINEAKNSNTLEQLRIKENEGTIIQEKLSWKKREDYLINEAKKVQSLLDSNYSLNIIANQYRNLASLYYIYDYMSSSQESLKDTLMHEHMENGIQRILERLDYIVDQNESIIFQNRIREADDKKIIGQNEQMLKILKQTAVNTSVSAQYAEISANYSRANAYFSYANYLKS